MRINRRLIPILLLALLIASLLLPCFAASAQADSKPSFGNLPSRYNSSTGYSAVIADEANLLTADEETRLLDKMYPLTDYANIAVYTVDTKTKLQDYERAREKRVELFGKDANAAVFMVDMYLRSIIIQRRGNMEDYFNTSRSNNITNNVAKIAKKGDYYKTCATAMDQMLSVVLERNNVKTDEPRPAVPRPMMYLSNGVIALMLGAMISYFIAVKTSTTVRKKALKNVNSSEAISLKEEPIKVKVLHSYMVDKKSVTRTSSDSGSSSCGGSSCGSSCGGGSSCGSSCGGSSF